MGVTQKMVDDKIEPVGSCERCSSPGTYMYRHHSLFFRGWWFYCEKHILEIKAELRIKYGKGW